MNLRLSAASALAVLALAAPAQAAPGPIPAADQVFPACSDLVTSYCVSAIEVDPGRTGTFVPAPANVMVRARLFSAFTDRDTLTVEAGLVINDGPSFADLVPAGTPVRFTVNTGAWTPPPAVSGAARVRSVSRSRDADVGWTLSFDVETIARTVGLDCSVGDGCDNPTSVVDEPSSLALQTLGPNLDQINALDPEMRAYNLNLWDGLTGAFFGTSASGYRFPPAFDVETGAISVEIASPHLTAAGDLNVGFVTAFMPDAAVASFWGSDPTSVAAAGAFVATRRDGTQVTPTTASVERVAGGVLITFDGITFSTPKLTLRPRKVLRAPRLVSALPGARGARVARVKASKVVGARRYQAACVRGRRTVFGRSRSRTVVVRGLSAQRWSCRVRAIYVVGGRWSPSAAVRVR